MILPLCTKEDVQRVIERIRYTTERQPIVVGHLNISITLSAGVPTSPHVKQLLQKAHEALYVAKAYGRNQVEVARHDVIIHGMVAKSN